MRGTDYLLKRTAFALLTIFVAATLNFVIFRAAPGDVASALRCRACTQEFKDQQRREFGLDGPKVEQFGTYLKELVTGNLGSSFVTRQPVWQELRGALANTLPMLALGTAISIVLGLASGSSQPGDGAPSRNGRTCRARCSSTRCRPTGSV